MLAQLDAIDGVHEARVDWTGRYFLLRCDRSVRAETIVARVAKQLGSNVQRLAPDDEQRQVDTFAAGAPWLRAGETARMSANEARVLAERYAADAGRACRLDAEQSTRLVALVQDELELLFKKFEPTGLPTRDAMTAEWNALADRVAARSRAFLTEAEVARVADYVRECCSR